MCQTLQKSSTSYLLKMRWIYRLDFLCFFGPSLGYPWITKHSLLNYVLLLVLISFLYIYSLNIFSFLSLLTICLHSSFALFLFPWLPSFVLFVLFAFHFYSIIINTEESNMYRNHHFFPCLHCHPHSYIRMVSYIYIC